MFNELTLPAIAMVVLAAILVAAVAKWCLSCLKSRREDESDRG